MPDAYFNLPSTISNGFATKSVVLNSAAELTSFYMSVYMDEDGLGEQFDLSLIYPINGSLRAQTINLQLEHPQAVQVYLIDSSGRRVWHRRYGSLSAITDTYQLAGLSAGRYKLCVVGTSGLLATVPVVKAR